MFKIRRANDRGHADHGWLDTHHTFSFADYHDPEHMGFRSLRVINDDRVAPGRGFGTHGHRDMEIISYVLEGALEHRDSMGTGAVIRPGDVQRMSAGSGVMHSEFNASKSEPVHFLQIWILPQRPGGAPSYEQKTFAAEQKRGRMVLVASPDGREGSVTVHADVALYAGILAAEQSVALQLGPGRHAWIHVAAGSITAEGEVLREGDGMAISDQSTLQLAGIESGEVLVFDLK